VGKPGCHLCDDARTVVSEVMQSMSDRSELSFTLTEVSIADDPALWEEYWEQIPVLLIDGRVHNFWRIDPVRLTRALEELA
jgi:glutaredoxin